ncbi:MAG: hypothetical protein NTY69_10040 [Methylococcales bacterium]|nr:hypothetical protein [Methylococcales bacterium]
MLIKRFILICTVPTLLVGCAVFSGSQEPAPVYGGVAKTQDKNATTAKGKKSKKQKVKEKVFQPKLVAPVTPVLPEIVEVKPLGDASSSALSIQELAPEPLTPEQQAVATEQNTPVESQPQAPVTSEQASDTSTTPPIVINNANGSVAVEEPRQELPIPVTPQFQPLETFAPLSPAVSALASAATQNTQAGKLEAATTILERAIRIEPRNAALYYKLALLKLKNSKPREAEDLAKKAALLAANDALIKKHSWLLIAKCRDVQGNVEGAKEARSKANGF